MRATARSCTCAAWLRCKSSVCCVAPLLLNVAPLYGLAAAQALVHHRCHCHCKHLSQHWHFPFEARRGARLAVNIALPANVDEPHHILPSGGQASRLHRLMVDHDRLPTRILLDEGAPYLMLWEAFLLMS